MQALVGVTKDGRVTIKTGVAYYEPVQHNVPPGPPRTSYRLAHGVRVSDFAAADVQARDLHGNMVPAKQWQKRVQGETLALVAFGPQAVDPLHLRLIRPGTLVFSVPAHPAEPPPPLPAALPAVPTVAPTVPLPAAEGIPAAPISSTAAGSRQT